MYNLEVLLKTEGWTYEKDSDQWVWLSSTGWVLGSLSGVAIQEAVGVSGPIGAVELVRAWMSKEYASFSN